MRSEKTHHHRAFFSPRPRPKPRYYSDQLGLGKQGFSPRSDSLHGRGGAFVPPAEGESAGWMLPFDENGGWNLPTGQVGCGKTGPCAQPWRR